jgi:hypothetical protein
MLTHLTTVIWVCDQLPRWATKCHFYNERKEIKGLQIEFGPSKGPRCVVNANVCNILPHKVEMCGNKREALPRLPNPKLVF